MEIRGGAWSASLCEATQPGRYEVIVVFELSKQRRVQAKEFFRRLPDASKGDFERLEQRETFLVGDR